MLNARLYDVPLRKTSKEKRGRINEATRHSHCVLRAVAEQGNLEKTKWLLDKGATVKGNRELMVNAIYGGNKEIVELFLEPGADYDFTFGADDRTPLSFAKMMGRDDIASLLESKGAKPPEVADDDSNELRKRQKSSIAFAITSRKSLSKNTPASVVR